MDHSVFSDKFTVKPTFSSTQWVIDTGATDHMVITTEFYTTKHIVDNISVNLPNGQSVMVTHIGYVQLTPTLLLTNVLCVPSFDFNLNAVSDNTNFNNLNYSSISRTFIESTLGSTPSQSVKQTGFYKKNQTDMNPT